MAIHIKEFDIHSYRGIKELKLNELNSINILTGDNNSGKTSVLELLSTIHDPISIGSWYCCARVPNARLRNKTLYNSFYNMFPVNDDKKFIWYKFIDSKDSVNSVRIEANIENVQMLEKEMHRLNGLIRTGAQQREEEVVDALCMKLQSHVNDEIEEYSIYDFQVIMSRFVKSESPFYRTEYVSPVGYAYDDVYLDDVLNDSELYNELINVLKEFDNKITRVTATKVNNRTTQAEYMIFTENHRYALPIQSYGDGMKKALLLISAVVKAKDGILLLDEFETAIHTSAMDSIFSWLLKSAMKLNVQVFLTSHSKEAIEKVLKSDSELQKHINLYTLYNYEGENYIRKMDCKDAVEAQDNLGLELR